MNEPPPSVTRTRRRVGLRAVARAARVCLQTASLALRNSPRLSARTRRRVCAIAEKLGYRPDPELSHLMSRLRPSRMLHGSVVIGMIDLHLHGSPEVHPYDAGVRLGITSRATALGFSVSLFRLSDYEGNLAQLVRVIRHRGIAGIVLLPSSRPVAFDSTIDWSGISVVAATTTVTSPQFHQVVPNQLHNITALIESIRRRGFTKIGAIFDEVLDRRTSQLYSIALTWHGHGRRILILPETQSASAASTRVDAWLRRHQPDVIVGGDSMTTVMQARQFSHLARGVALVALTSRPGARMAYLDQRPALIGEGAVSQLSGMMHNHETGIPAVPQTTTIRGILCEPEATTRPLKIARRA